MPALLLLPAPLRKGATRFEAWRRNRTGRWIPDDLWGLAAELGSRYGVSRTSKALGISYYDLKKRVEALTAAEGGAARPAFVEIRPSQLSSQTECVVVELESASGAKLRMRITGGGAPDLAMLSRLFLEERR
jgi:hypothetical protein